KADGKKSRREAKAELEYTGHLGRRCSLVEQFRHGLAADSHGDREARTGEDLIGNLPIQTHRNRLAFASAEQRYDRSRRGGIGGGVDRRILVEKRGLAMARAVGGVDARRGIRHL